MPMIPESIVIHLSDGDTSVQKAQVTDTFILNTHKNEYQWVEYSKQFIRDVYEQYVLS